MTDDLDAVARALTEAIWMSVTANKSSIYELVHTALRVQRRAVWEEAARGCERQREREAPFFDKDRFIAWCRQQAEEGR